MATPQQTKRDQRFETRMTLEQKRMLEHAAALKGTSVTGFMLAAAEAAAREVIDHENLVKLSRRDSEILFQALTKPPKPNKALKEAMKMHKKLVGKDRE